MATCTCGHDESLHESPRATYAYAVPCRRIGCTCTTYTPAPAGEAASASSRPAGAPLYSEDRCETCGRITDCCGNCRCERTTK